MRSSPVFAERVRRPRGLHPVRTSSANDPLDSGPSSLPVATLDALARDRDLLARWGAGDAEAGMELIGLYKRLFYRTCLSLGMRDEHATLEVLQEVVLRLLQDLPSLPQRLTKSFGGFYYWLVRDTVLRQRRAPPVEMVQDRVDPSHSARVELSEAIESCRCRLPPREREVFDRRFLQGMSLKEVAADLDSNVNAVGQAVFRLAAKMRECLRRSGF